MLLPENTDELLQQLLELHQGAVEFAERPLLLEKIAEQNRTSVRNFLHYVYLRQFDLRPLQQKLREAGLASLGGFEAHALDTLSRVISNLSRLTNCKSEVNTASLPGFRESALLRERNSRELFGEKNNARGDRIMVTMPSDAAINESLIEALMKAGMNVMRVNCAHDNAEVWQAMIRNMQEASKRCGRSCRVQIDLSGPKFRTGTIGAMGYVLKIQPKRDYLGKTITPARLWLVPDNAARIEDAIHPSQQISGKHLEGFRAGDTVHLRDARDSKRKFTVVREQGGCYLVESKKTTYIAKGTKLEFRHGKRTIGKARAVDVPAAFRPLWFHASEELILTRENLPGSPVIRDKFGQQIEAARIHCTLEEAFEVVKPGESVWLDDGKIGAQVLENNGEEIRLSIKHVAPGGSKLQAEKGINFPDARFQAPALTDKDLKDIKALIDDIDMIALSFVRTSEDLEDLHRVLSELGREDIGVILKIENRLAFENLPDILLTALKFKRVGVMVARGDLAVEVGFDRLSEVQEEILWLCEAAHVPVIWATQILENLAKQGSPTRAEVSDAALSIRAECTMLNKGPNIVDTVKFLSGIQQRMASHYSKREIMLRPLKVVRKNKLC